MVENTSDQGETVEISKAKALDKALQAQVPFVQNRHGPLLVIVPGFSSKPHNFSRFLQALLQSETVQLDTADCLPFPCRATGYETFTYQTGLITGLGKDPDEAARHLLDATEKRLLDAKAEQSNDSALAYPRIFFIGHSFGGLIVRRAILELLTQSTRESPKRWPNLLEQVRQENAVRLILLASANRGFTRTNLERWHFTLPIWFAVGERMPYFAQHIVLNAARGAPWINNLRINWLKWRPTNGLPAIPEVIQIVGDDDEVVDQDDSLDIFGLSGGYQVTIPKLRHRNFLNEDVGKGYLWKPLTDNRKAGHPTTRFDLLLLAFEENTSRIRHLSAEQQGIDLDVKGAETSQPQLQPEWIVLLIHGIRDFADWQESLEWAWNKRNQSKRNRIRYVEVRYGYFSAWQFLFRFERDRVAQCVADRYSQELARLSVDERLRRRSDPKAPIQDIRIVAIAHSNGTYALARALEEHPAMSFSRVYLCGSVLTKSFPWNFFIRSGGQVEMLRNDCASADWPVGVLCPLVRLLPWNYKRPWFFGKPRLTVLGNGGVKGFEAETSLSEKHFLNNRYLKGDHGVALGSRNAEEIWNFIETAQIQHSKLPANIGDPDVTDAPARGALWRIATATYLGLIALILVFVLGLGACQSMGDKLVQSPTWTTLVNPIVWLDCFRLRFEAGFPWIVFPSASFLLAGLFALGVAWGITWRTSRA